MRILALHGQMGMASDWEVHSEALSALGHQVFAVDLWSYLERGEVSLGEIGKKLNEDHDDGMVLMGYSMGGRLALKALIDEPNKWKAAVIISAHTGLDWEERECRRKVDDDWASKLEHSSWLEFLNVWNHQDILGNDVMPDRTALEARKNEIARSFRCWSLAEQGKMLDQLGTVGIPVLWVVGEKDEKFSKIGENSVEILKCAQLVKVQDSGHRVPWEAGTELVDVVARFLRTAL
jgi:2-succinyl-6-hydroxy-2,4-cyclohexadiene-1-carboxylate synthase